MPHRASIRLSTTGSRIIVEVSRSLQHPRSLPGPLDNWVRRPLLDQRADLVPLSRLRRRDLLVGAAGETDRAVRCPADPPSPLPSPPTFHEQPQVLHPPVLPAVPAPTLPGSRVDHERVIRAGAVREPGGRFPAGGPRMQPEMFCDLNDRRRTPRLGRLQRCLPLRGHPREQRLEVLRLDDPRASASPTDRRTRPARARTARTSGGTTHVARRRGAPFELRATVRRRPRRPPIARRTHRVAPSTPPRRPRRYRC